MNPKRRSVMFSAVAAALGLGSVGTFVAAQSKERVIKIAAKRFTFTPEKITLKKGQPVVFEFRTLDVFMGFNLPDFNVRADIIPEKAVRVSFVPDKTGTFVFLCDVFCGDGHEKMSGQITVVA
jgi:cytochrome c oxidase subunit 2